MTRVRIANGTDPANKATVAPCLEVVKVLSSIAGAVPLLFDRC